ncbi:MAG TPA: dihydropteroate synthase [Acidimicrobiales bacterium]|nr:dihydropteroate synthase [Acidimicrobiales bacterium]
MTLVMGVLNVTPDSFSDGGRWLDPDAAVAHGLTLFAEGADVVDVGGESTRPGATPVPEDEELRRVVPVVNALAARGRGSIDTPKPAVAEAAGAAGATIVNDVSASPALAGVAAAAGVGYVAMHMQGTPQTMQEHPHYDDVVREVTEFLVRRAEAARGDGVREVWIDPGIGFGKTAAHNLSLLHHLGVLVRTGWPVLVGASRKRFVQVLTGAAGPDDALEGSLAAAVVAAASGAGMVRVHDVAATVQAMRIVGQAGGNGGNGAIVGEQA